MKGERRRWIRSVLRHFMRELRIIQARHPAVRPACHTCAFNPDTDTMAGAERTAHNLFMAINGDWGLFYCHENMPFEGGEWRPPEDRSQMRVCAGYASIAKDPETKTAMKRAVARTWRPTWR